MKKFLATILCLLMFPAMTAAELDLSAYPLVFTNEYADIYFDTIEIQKNAMKIYCICENKTDTDLSFRLRRCLVNGWDIIESTTFDGYFRVSANSRKRDCFEFEQAVTVSGISDPETITALDFSLVLKPWDGGSAIFEQEDYTHYDLLPPAAEETTP